jgi:hypothetical protein
VLIAGLAFMMRSSTAERAGVELEER